MKIQQIQDPQIHTKRPFFIPKVSYFSNLSLLPPRTAQKKACFVFKILRIISTLMIAAWLQHYVICHWNPLHMFFMFIIFNTCLVLWFFFYHLLCLVVGICPTWSSLSWLHLGPHETYSPSLTFLSDPSPIIVYPCNSLTDSLLFSKLDWSDPGVWRCQLKTCWARYCCWCWCLETCWQ